MIYFITYFNIYLYTYILWTPKKTPLLLSLLFLKNGLFHASMNIAIICSKKDPAGMAFKNAFGQKKEEASAQGISLHVLDDELLISDNLEKDIPSDIFIFASKHRSSSNTKSFAVHSIGNFGEGTAGGRPNQLCPTSAHLQHAIFLQLLKRRRDGYEVTMEATHHGPFMKKPSLFVEVGSTEEEWDDPINSGILVDSIMGGLSHYLELQYGMSNKKNPIIENKNNENKQSEKGAYDTITGENNIPQVAIGIGGPHYCNNFNKLAQRKNIAFGHICPKFNLEKLDEGMLRQAIEKIHEKVDMIVLDWKGLGAEKQRIVDMLKRIGIPVERTDKILKEN